MRSAARPAEADSSSQDLGNMRLVISAGEASGDAYGAAILDALPPSLGGVQMSAIGGPKLKRAGAAIIADSSRWGAISIYASLLVAPRVISGLLRAKRVLSLGRPGVFIPIDFGFANIRLARVAKRLGWKVLYFIPPGSWRRDRQGKDLPDVADLIVTPFSWSAEILNSMGAKAYWFGHPIKSLARTSQAPDSTERKGVAILPGSRDQEVRHLLPVIAQAVAGLPPVEFAVAATLDPVELRQKWELQSGREGDTFTPDDVYGVLGRARAAIVCSGTATLQAAVTRCPMVVVYRVSEIALLQARLLRLDKKIKFISLPNIFLERAAVPELIQQAANPQNVRKHLDELLDEGVTRASQLAAFEELDSLLGPPDCIERTARLIEELANG